MIHHPKTNESYDGFMKDFAMDKIKTYVVDIDNTICTQTYGRLF